MLYHPSSPTILTPSPKKKTPEIPLGVNINNTSDHYSPNSSVFESFYLPPGSTRSMTSSKHSSLTSTTIQTPKHPIPPIHLPNPLPRTIQIKRPSSSYINAVISLLFQTIFIYKTPSHHITSHYIRASSYAKQKENQRTSFTSPLNTSRFLELSTANSAYITPHCKPRREI